MSLATEIPGDWTMSSDSSVGLSLVIPAYNEEQRLPETLGWVLHFLLDRQDSFEVIVVDDGSTDSTAELARNFEEQYSQVRLVSYPNNRGKGAAVKRGLEEAQGDKIGFLDADLSVSIDELPKMVDRLDEHDLVIGVRHGRSNQTLFRRLGSWLINQITQIVLAGTTDSQCGFKVFKKTAAKRIARNLTQEGFSFDVEVLHIARLLSLSVHEVPVSWKHVDGSKVCPIRDGFRFIVAVLQLRFERRQYA